MKKNALDSGMYDHLPCLDGVVTNHGRIGFKTNWTVRVNEPKRSMLLDPVVNIAQAPSSKLDVPAD